MLSWSAPRWLVTLLLSLCGFMWVMFLGSWPTVAILHLETMEEQGCGMAASGYLSQEQGGGLLKFWDYQLAPFYQSVYRRTLRVFVLFRFVFRGRGNTGGRNDFLLALARLAFGNKEAGLKIIRAPCQSHQARITELLSLHLRGE